MTDSHRGESDEHSLSEILRWQAKYRIAFAVGIGGAATLLRSLGILSTQSVAFPHLDASDAAQAFAAMAIAYVLTVVAVHWRLGVAAKASLRLLGFVLTVDVAYLFGVASIVTPPSEYDRTLIMCMILGHVTQVYFGWRATLYQFGLVVVSYVSLLAIAQQQGFLASPVEKIWTLALFCIGVLTYTWMIAHQGARTRQLTQLFARAREGDFDTPYDEGRDRFFDHITQIGRAYNKLRGHLETIVLTDPLSGCFNRRGFDQFAAREVSRGVRAKWHMAVLALDVDHFKQINDDFGHLTGDEAIREIGAVIRETARAGDVVARIGGEEFSILAPDTDAAGAMHLAERILTAFRTRSFHSLRGRMPITISIGVASDEAAAEDIVRTLTARADEALYVAKRNGRDQAVMWQTGMRAFDAVGRASH